MTTLVKTDDNLLYPDSDGKLMAENTEQYDWIVIIKENLEILFAQRSDVFIAGDLMWYPIQVEEPPAPCQAPDVMVAFGRPKGRRGSYRQWQENNIAPQVVFEILSPSNKTRDGQEGMNFKFLFYQRYGVQEYYIYDPEQYDLEGWMRQDNHLIPIDLMSGWISPLLQIQFAWHPQTELQLYYPNGRKFLTSVKLAQQLEEAQQQAKQERQSRLDAIPRLLKLGFNTKQIAETLGLPEVEVAKLTHDI